MGWREPRVYSQEIITNNALIEAYRKMLCCFVWNWYRSRVGYDQVPREIAAQIEEPALITSNDDEVYTLEL